MSTSRRITKIKGSFSMENNKCTKWGMVVKGRNEKPEKDYI